MPTPATAVDGAAGKFVGRMSRPGLSDGGEGDTFATEIRAATEPPKKLFRLPNVSLNPLDWAKGQAAVLKNQVLSTRERIRWNAAISGTNFLYNSPAVGSRPAVNGVITLGRIQKAVQTIEATKGETFTKDSTGSTKIGSSPVEAGYYCFAHTNAHPDIRNLPGFTKRAEMASSNDAPGQVAA